MGIRRRSVEVDTSAYNEYFLNYLKNDRTGRAVMLTAPWGTGKSFYIRNELKPFLESKGLRCVVVSLYGLHSISDISKSIYLELRAGNLAKKSEGKAIAGIIGKTIVKGIAGYFGVPLEISDDDLKKLYSSINLKSKLIILEDLERSELDPVSVLGFVNGLVEDDGGKVLLVANESEIADGDKGAFTSWTGSSNAKYRLVKEKTIGDTIHFQLDPRKSISEVFSSYGNFLLKNKAERESLVEQILSVMSELKDYNLRTLIFAIQKTADIFSKFEEATADFVCETLLGILAYSFRINHGEKAKWEDENSARALGTASHPLFRFAYLYLNSQQISEKTDLMLYQKVFREEREISFAEKAAGNAISLLRSYYLRKESEVAEAVVALRDCLVKDRIPIESYGTLINYLVTIRECLHDPKPIEECKAQMIHNASKGKLNKNKRELFMKFEYSSGFQLETPSQIQEYNDFVQKLKATISKAKGIAQEKNGQVTQFLNEAKDEGQYIEEMRLFSLIDPYKFAEEIYTLEASQLQEVRDTFLEVYCRVTNIRDYLSGDLDNLQKLKEIIDNHIKNAEFTDFVIRKQFEYLSHNLGAAIANLGGH